MKRVVALLGIVLLTGAFTQAIVIKSNDKVDVIFGAFVPCSGEFLTLEGRLHFTDHITFNDNNYNFKSHAQPMNLMGVGTQGNKYVGTGVTKSGDTGSWDGFPWNYTYVNNFRMIGQGQAPNYMVHETRHVTVNANGELTSFVDNYRVTCE